MNNERQFFRCEICGNLVEKIEDSGVSMVCCGQEMTLLHDNVVDAAHEKHVPVISKDYNKIMIKIGSVPHPMTNEHHIGWIVITCDDFTVRKRLNPGDAPEVTIPSLCEGKITAYAWCNLHGLWSSEVQ